MSAPPKIATVSVINDLVTDHRVQKTCQVLLENGFRVILIGRRLKTSLPLPAWPYKAYRMRLFFTKGPLFYLFFNLRLFFKLMFSNSDLLYANDLDTLLPNYLVSKLKGIPLIYDSHELFCEVPELIQNPLKRRIWSKLESFVVPKLKFCITVNASIAEIYRQKYKVDFAIVRNIPDNIPESTVKTRTELGLPEDKKIVLLQGAGINMDRGAEELLEAIKQLEGVLLLIIGSGDNWQALENTAKQSVFKNKVRLIRKLPRQELLQYTRCADLGVSFDKATNLNYIYSLPNKIFDYIQCGIPVLASRLPEIEKVINTYKVGEFIENHNSTHIAERIKNMLDSPKLAEYKSNTRIASETLNWQKEKLKLTEILERI